jgi:hypothetical protein
LAASILGVIGLVSGIIFGTSIVQNTMSENRTSEVEDIAPSSNDSEPMITTAIKSTDLPSSNNLISVQLPTDLTCKQHSSGYCGLTMTVSWSNIDPNRDYYIYTIGHGLYYQPEMWWVAGNGVPINNSSGSWKITDGAYGNPGDTLGVFACLTTNRYSFSAAEEILFDEIPKCEMYSEEIYFQPE